MSKLDDKKIVRKTPDDPNIDVLYRSVIGKPRTADQPFCGSTLLSASHVACAHYTSNPIYPQARDELSTVEDDVRGWRVRTYKGACFCRFERPPMYTLLIFGAAFIGSLPKLICVLGAVLPGDAERRRDGRRALEALRRSHKRRQKVKVDGPPYKATPPTDALCAPSGLHELIDTLE